MVRKEHLIVGANLFYNKKIWGNHYNSLVFSTGNLGAKIFILKAHMLICIFKCIFYFYIRFPSPHPLLYIFSKTHFYQYRYKKTYSTSTNHNCVQVQICTSTNHNCVAQWIYVQGTHHPDREINITTPQKPSMDLFLVPVPTFPSKGTSILT